jgi:hypothetical protein
MTVCSNAVENRHIGALAREAGNVKTGETKDAPCGRGDGRTKEPVWESLRDSVKARMKNYR